MGSFDIYLRYIWFEEEYGAFFVVGEMGGEDVACGSGADAYDVGTHGISLAICAVVAVV